LGVLPPGGSSLPELVRIHLPAGAPIQSALDLKLVLTSGDSFGGTPDPSDLGTLELSADWGGAHWSVFADPSGSPIGVTENVYRYDGTLPSQPTSEVYHPFACEAE
jgi:hypothetical protein